MGILEPQPPKPHLARGQQLNPPGTPGYPRAMAELMRDATSGGRRTRWRRSGFASGTEVVWLSWTAPIVNL